MNDAQNGLLPGERWLPVVGYEGWYEVSDHGRVRRIKAAQRTRPGRVLNPRLVMGYPRVNLCVENQRRGYSVHRLVAHAFIGSCPDGLQVNHIDGDKTNNAVSNLEYVTPSENHFHAHRLGLQNARGENNGQAKLTEADVHSIRALLGTMPHTEIAERFDVSGETICAIVHGRAWAWLKEEE